MTHHCDPVAGPLAWSSQRDSACTRAGCGPHLPANDFSLVSPAQLSCRSGRLVVRVARAFAYTGLTGEVISVPLVAPFAWSSCCCPSIPSCFCVPAKQKKDEVQPGEGQGGGL